MTAAIGKELKGFGVSTRLRAGYDTPGEFVSAYTNQVGCLSSWVDCYPELHEFSEQSLSECETNACRDAVHWGTRKILKMWGI